jgi:hypothetical protein
MIRPTQPWTNATSASAVTGRKDHPINEQGGRRNAATLFEDR